MSTVSAGSTHGELKRAIARRIGSDPDRYSAESGTERHNSLTNDEITGICEVLGLGFLAAEPNQVRRNAIMLKIGREHRTGVRHWDSSDLRAVLLRLQEMDDE